MSGLREKIAEAIGIKMAGAPEHGKYYGKEADAALAAFRQWLADEGLVVVPKSPGVVREGNWLYEAVKDASLRAAKNGRVAPQLMFAPILWAMQDALKSAPDLGDGP
jgi:hypothetical protein